MQKFNEILRFTLSFVDFLTFLVLQAVASIVHGNDVDVEIIKRKGEDDTDHVQFAITDKKRKRNRLEREGSLRCQEKSGKKNIHSEKKRKSRCHDIIHEDEAAAAAANKVNEKDKSHQITQDKCIDETTVKQSVGIDPSDDETLDKNVDEQKDNNDGKDDDNDGGDDRDDADVGGNDVDDNGDDDDDEDDDDEGNSLLHNVTEFSDEMAMMSLENKISPLTFCNAFPFHLVFDRDLNVRQVSHSLIVFLSSLHFLFSISRSLSSHV